MASIRERGDSYLLVVPMGYDHNGKRRAARQKTVKPPNGLTPKQKEKWLNEQAVFFEKEYKETSLAVDKSITLEEYVKIWLRDVAPDKLAKATLAQDKLDIGRFMPYLGQYKLTKLRSDHFRKLSTPNSGCTAARTPVCRSPSIPLRESMPASAESCLTRWRAC